MSNLDLIDTLTTEMSEAKSILISLASGIILNAKQGRFGGMFKLGY
jgi:hypothetical protein